MEHLYFHDLAAITNGNIVTEVDNLPITACIIDSKSKVITPFPIFFAIIGPNHNGHDYIQEAYENGIRQFVVSNGYEVSLLQNLKGINLLQVVDTLGALQQCASVWRLRYNLPILAITGSNGKTIVKEWMYLFLSKKYTTIASPHSYNSQVGVPLSVLLIKPLHERAIFEVGISQKDEMTKLEDILKPTHGLFTNIGDAHNQGFSSLREKAQEKAKLFAHCHTIYYCKDHSMIDAVIQAAYGQTKKIKTWTLQNHPSSDYHVTCLPQTGKTKLTIVAYHANEPNALNLSTLHASVFWVPFQDKLFLENVIHCLIYLLDNGLDPVELQATLNKLMPLLMRTTRKDGMHDCTIIDDTYLNSLSNIRVALDGLYQEKRSKKTVILTDLMPSSIEEHVRYSALNKLLLQYDIDKCIGIGATISSYATLFALKEAIFFNTVQDFIQEGLSFKDEIILVKTGPIQDRIVRSIEKNTHATILEIDMHAIRHNLSLFRQKIHAQTKIMAMVKSSAYGSNSNSFEFVAALERYGIDYLGVAYVDEGIYLRQKGIRLPIMVMLPTGNYVDAIIKYHLEPEIYSLELLEALSHATQKHAPPIPIHIKLETGMQRLGIAPTEVESLLTLLAEAPQLQVVTIFSHLAASQDSIHDAFTLYQAETFQRLAEYIEGRVGRKIVKHLLNSNGILRFPQFQWDMVRLGIGLYGVGLDAPFMASFMPANTLKTTIAQIKSIPQGTTIGYDRKGLAVQDMTIAIIPIGYADGLSRKLGCGRGHVMIKEKLCPIIGNICMDITMVDVSGISIKIGDEVIVFGADHSIDTLAQNAGTISYELLTQISQRVKRMYVS